MDLIATWPGERRRTLFEETAAARDLSAVLIEKDFWVCWALARLFTLETHPTLVFKGGTALSKVYAAIRRFSEDIDLTFDRGVFALDDAVVRATTVTQREKFLDQIDDRAKQYVAETLLPDLTRAVRAKLPGGEWQLTVEKGQTRHWDHLLFRYPLSLARQEYGFADYNRPVVRIELVARGEYWPDRPGVVRPYAADSFPGLFTNATAAVRALAVERTFWEKATLLHREYHVAGEKPAKPGLSRHYADLAVLADTRYGEDSLREIGLLAIVAQHKATFFREPLAQYETARPGTLRLVPADSRVDELRTDYRRMTPMFFDRAPSFDAVLERLRQLQDDINARAAT